MPDVFIGQMAYNGGTYLQSAISTGRISISVNNSVDLTGRIWCGTCGVCYQYTLIADSFYLSKTNEFNSRPMCFCSAGPNNTDLIDTINSIAQKKSAGPFLSVSTAMSWVRDEGLFVTNQNYPSITTLNHIMLLDAGLTSSYPNQGTDWFNMASNNNNGTLSGGIVWDNNVLGSLDFNGSTGVVSFTTTQNIPVGNSNYTISVWFNPDSLGTKGLIGWGGYGTNNAVNAIRLTATGIENVWEGNNLSVTTSVSTGNWHNVVATFDGTTRILYLDGVQIGSDTPTNHNVTTSSNMTIGRTDSSQYFDGKISFVQIFDYAITSDQVFDSYTNFNTRYNDTYTQICPDPLDDPFFCNSPTPTPTSISPTPTPTPPPTPQPKGQCVNISSYETGVIFIDYARVDGTQGCSPLGQGQTLPFCVRQGESLNIESWRTFPCADPSTLLPPSAIAVIPVPNVGGCYNNGDCVVPTMTAIDLCWDESGFEGIDQLGCGLTRLCVCANQ
jgi:hypothetical protein